MTAKLHNFQTFEIENDLDSEEAGYPGFFSIYGYNAGSGAELVGKIGERSIAEFILNAFQAEIDPDQGSIPGEH